MNKVLIALAAAALALPVAPVAEAGFSVGIRSANPIVQMVGCGEDCAEYAAEAAEEYAEERESAAEDDEGGYRRLWRSAGRRYSPSAQVARGGKSESSSSGSAKEETEKANTRRSKSKSDVAVAGSDSCKKYMPSVGMTLSVPCE